MARPSPLSRGHQLLDRPCVQLAPGPAEYVLNVAATRYGYGTYSGAQMATFHLAFGIVCVALVSRFILGEPLTTKQVLGFALLVVGTVLVTYRP